MSKTYEGPQSSQDYTSQDNKRIRVLTYFLIYFGLSSFVAGFITAFFLASKGFYLIGTIIWAGAGMSAVAHAWLYEYLSGKRSA